jgi:hypothetical protein
MGALSGFTPTDKYVRRGPQDNAPSFALPQLLFVTKRSRYGERTLRDSHPQQVIQNPQGRDHSPIFHFCRAFRCGFNTVRTSDSCPAMGIRA